MSAPDVVAVIATYQRPAELSRLLHSLAASGVPLRGVVVVDNSASAAVQAVVERAPLQIHYEAAPANLGCGGGLRRAEEIALQQHPELTHLWILDDDAEIEPGTLPLLLAAQEAGGAWAAHPMVIDAAGRLSWYPGLLDRRRLRLAQRYLTPEEFRRAAGAEPMPFSWAQGIALLVTRAAVDSLGLHRDDYWVRGEDLEFSLRVTRHHPGLYVPQAQVRHLPPASSQSPAAEYPKHLALLQNLAYTAVRLPHGRRILRTLPGNWWRFHRQWGWRFAQLRASTGAFWRGAVRGWPAGAGSYRPGG